MSEPPVLLQVADLHKHYAMHGHEPTRAVDGVSFETRAGETFALVGESGSGKSTTAKVILRLTEPTAGTVTLSGRDVHALRRGELPAFRRTVQAVFQDPWSSLNPRRRIGATIAEPLVVCSDASRVEVRRRIDELLDDVGLDRGVAKLYPHELSGGMRQRVALARALALKPTLIVLDEPVSALDVSIRAQIMNLLKDLQDAHGMAYLLIAHDLATVRYLSHQVGVLYQGRLVELAPAEEIFTHPSHDYTRRLLAAAALGRDSLAQPAPTKEQG